MDIPKSVGRFFNKHVDSSDFIRREAKVLGLGVGSVAVGATVGYHIGKDHGIKNYGEGGTVDVDRTYFVKTGTETYTGTCHGRTSSGETMTFQCAQVRNTGYNITRTEQVDAAKHFALRGAGIGAAVGLAGGIAAGVATYVLSDPY